MCRTPWSTRTRDGTTVLVVGGRTHIDKGNPVDVDAELWTTLLDGVVAYDPAEMLVVVDAGIRLRDLRLLLAEGGQEWPVDGSDDATVGGVIAAAIDPIRQLRVGRMRDTVVEMEVVTGDGRRDQERRAGREERHRLRRPSAPDRFLRDPRLHHPGRAEGAPAAEGREDAHHG